MLLALVSDVVSQLGFDPMTDINFAVKMAMDAAEPYLAARLNTDFDKGTFVDTFYVGEPRYQDGPAVSTELRLRRGLINSVTSVLTCSDPTAFADPTATTNVTAVIQLHPDKGIVKDFTTRYDRQYVQVTYVAGFDADGGDPTSYTIAQVPNWLQNAAKLKTLIGLVDSPTLSEAQIKLDAKLLTPQLDSLLSRKLRYAPLAFLPL